MLFTYQRLYRTRTQPVVMADLPLSRRELLSALGGAAAVTAFGGAAMQSGTPAVTDVDAVRLDRVGRYETGEFDGGAEITAYYPAGKQLFTVNSGAGQIEVLDVSDPTDPTQAATLDAAGDVDGGGANSVDVVGDLAAVAVEATDPQETGFAALYDAADLELLNVVEVGALPDKVTIAPDGNYVITADEGEPDFEESAGSRTDPRGSVSVVDVSGGAGSATVETLTFEAFDDEVESLREEGVRVVGASAEDDDITPSRDFEPEFVTVGPGSETAYVTLQENNAVAVVDVPGAEIVDVVGLGAKDFSLPGNEFDASDVDGVSLQNWPVQGLYQPDALDVFTVAGETFVATANEGDAREFEEVPVKDLDLDPEAFDLSENAYVDSVDELQAPENIGNLDVTTELGDVDDDGRYEELYAFGARSVAVWQATDDGLDLVAESGGEIEERYAELYPEAVRNNNTDETGGGPQTEGVETGRVGGRTFGFVGIERGSGVLVYDLTAPTSPRFVQGVVNRDFSVTFGDLLDDPESPGRGGDFSPEGIEFVPAADSPVANPLLAVGYEVSGTVGVFEVTPLPDGATGRSGDAPGRGGDGDGQAEGSPGAAGEAGSDG